MDLEELDVCVFRILHESYPDVEIVAVNDIVPPDNLAYLLKFDSVHRSPAFNIKAEGQYLDVDGKKTLVVSEKDPAKLPWKSLGVEYVIESSGHFTNVEDAQKHIQAGAKTSHYHCPCQRRLPHFCHGG